MQSGYLLLIVQNKVVRQGEMFERGLKKVAKNHEITAPA